MWLCIALVPNVDMRGGCLLSLKGKDKDPGGTRGSQLLGIIIEWGAEPVAEAVLHILCHLHYIGHVHGTHFVTFNDLCRTLFFL